MNTDKERQLRDLSLISEQVDDLLKDLPDADHFDVAAQRQIAMAESGATVGLPVDGRVEIDMVDDDMMCVAHFFPPEPGGRPVSLSDAQDLIGAKGITYGLDWKVVEDCVFRCNTEGIDLTGVPIARGKPPVPATPPHFEIASALLASPRPDPMTEDRIDFKTLSPYVIVKAGDVLASRTAAAPGTSGYTVRGRELPPPTAHGEFPRFSSNTRVAGTNIVAACDGRFVREGDTYSVSPVLVVRGDVDYSTGNIDFSGDVIIEGDVKQGFSIKCTGDLHIGKTLSAQRVECGGDLTTGRGILGRGTGQVMVAGSVTCKFIENCYVEAAGDINAHVGILNSTVNSLGRIVTGSKGILVGGKMHAQNGVHTYQIGTSLGPATEIYCGIDYTVQRQLDWIRDRSSKIAEKIAELAGRGTSAPPQVLEYVAKLKAALRKLADASVGLLPRLDKNDRATIAIYGTLFPNSYLEICHASFVVTRPAQFALFRLNKESGAIAHEPLKRGFPKSASRE